MITSLGGCKGSIPKVRTSPSFRSFCRLARCIGCERFVDLHICQPFWSDLEGTDCTLANCSCKMQTEFGRCRIVDNNGASLVLGSSFLYSHIPNACSHSLTQLTDKHQLNIAQWCSVAAGEVANAAQAILCLCEDARTLPLFAEAQGELKKAHADFRQAPPLSPITACTLLHQGHICLSCLGLQTAAAEGPSGRVLKAFQNNQNIRLK